MTIDPVDIEPMTVADLPSVLAIERASFASPWTEANFRHEIEGNPLAWNLVARVRGAVAAFACAYVVGDEVMINDIAVDPSLRRAGLARALYESFGFSVVGRRPGYYADTGEDALLLTYALSPG